MNVKNNGTIRAFTENDYQAVVEILNTVFPERLDSVHKMRSADRERDPRSRRGRWVFEQSDRVVAVAEYRQDMSDHQGLSFIVQLTVNPDHCRRGIGGKLYTWLEKALAPHEPTALLVETATPEGLGFLRDRGFRETVAANGSDKIIMIKQTGEAMVNRRRG